MERIKTGIKGFDELIEGGVPKGFNVLITGAPGTGKTIFGLKYIYTGCKNGENGLYISLDASDGSIRRQADQFGWDIEKLEKEGKLTILEIPLNKAKINIFDMIEEAASEIKAKRLVFDSLAAFSINIDQFAIPLALDESMQPLADHFKQVAASRDKKYRYEVMPSLDQDPKGRSFYTGGSEKRIAYLVINELTSLGTTNVIITDAKQQGSEQLTVDGVSEFVSDGLVTLKSLTIGETLSRTLEVMKMRCTKIDGGIKSYEIGSQGITILR